MSVRGVSGPVRRVRVAAQHAGQVQVSWWDDVLLLATWGMLDTIALIYSRWLLVVFALATAVHLVGMLRRMEAAAAAERERARLIAEIRGRADASQVAQR